MKKSAGFTLIELVIVIVILGILGAVAAPRFINMQGDAYEANVKALNGSIQSAMTLANTKAILGGYDQGTREAGTVSDEDELGNVKFVNGFPAATEFGIIRMLQNSESFDDNYQTDPKGTNVLIIAPKARDIVKGGAENEKCQVEYTQATDTEPAKVKAFTEGC